MNEFLEEKIRDKEKEILDTRNELIKHNITSLNLEEYIKKYILLAEANGELKSLYLIKNYLDQEKLDGA